jgi:hypothetical protein
MDLEHQLEREGFALLPGALDAPQLKSLLEVISSPPAAGEVRPGLTRAHACRNVLWEQAELAPALTRLGIDAIATEALGVAAFPINALYFDKTAGANWKVPSHQDLMMPVEEEVREPGFSGWSERAGVLHVEPPVEVLTKLVALRIHFDDCPAANGALAVIPGSHHRGKLGDAGLTGIERELFQACAAAAGDVLLMKPLIIHRSSPAASPSHRRVLHVVYASEEPGGSLRWKRSAR